jgi:hypothetical protein
LAEKTDGRKIFLPGAGLAIFLPSESVSQRADQSSGAPFASLADSCIHAVKRGTLANSLGRRR